MTLTVLSEIEFESFTFFNITKGNESSHIVYQNLNFVTYGNATTFYLRNGSYKMIAKYENGNIFETIIDDNQTWPFSGAPTVPPTSAPTSLVNITYDFQACLLNIV